MLKYGLPKDVPLIISAYLPARMGPLLLSQRGPRLSSLPVFDPRIAGPLLKTKNLEPLL